MHANKWLLFGGSFMLAAAILNLVASEPTRLSRERTGVYRKRLYGFGRDSLGLYARRILSHRPA